MAPIDTWQDTWDEKDAAEAVYVINHMVRWRKLSKKAGEDYRRLIRENLGQTDSVIATATLEWTRRLKPTGGFTTRFRERVVERRIGRQRR